MNGFNKQDKTTNPSREAPYKKVKESSPSNKKLPKVEEADPTLINPKSTPHTKNSKIHTNPTNSWKTVKGMNKPTWKKAKKPIKEMSKNLLFITNPSKSIKLSPKGHSSQNYKTSKANPSDQKNFWCQSNSSRKAISQTWKTKITRSFKKNFKDWNKKRLLSFVCRPRNRLKRKYWNKWFQKPLRTFTKILKEWQNKS